MRYEVYHLLESLVRSACAHESEDTAEVLRAQLAAVRIAMQRKRAEPAEPAAEPAAPRSLVLVALWSDGSPVHSELRDRVALAISQALEQEG